jgi:hypothetical protein
MGEHDRFGHEGQVALVPRGETVMGSISFPGERVGDGEKTGKAWGWPENDIVGPLR